MLIALWVEEPQLGTSCVHMQTAQAVCVPVLPKRGAGSAWNYWDRNWRAWGYRGCFGALCDACSIPAGVPHAAFSYHKLLSTACHKLLHVAGNACHKLLRQQLVL